MYIYHLMNCITILKFAPQKLDMYRSTYVLGYILISRWFGPHDLLQNRPQCCPAWQSWSSSIWRWCLKCVKKKKGAGSCFSHSCRPCLEQSGLMDGLPPCAGTPAHSQWKKWNGCKKTTKNKQKVEQSGVMDSQWKNWMWKTNKHKVKQTGMMDCLLVAPVHLPIHSFPSHLFKRIKTKTTKIKKI